LTEAEEAQVVKAAEALQAALSGKPWKVEAPGQVAGLVRRLKLPVSKSARAAGAGATPTTWLTARKLSEKNADRESAGPAMLDLATRYAHDSMLLRVAKVLECVAQSMRDQRRHGHDRLMGVEVDAGGKGQFLVGRKRADVYDGWGLTPALILDATADPAIVQQWFPGEGLTVIEDAGIRPFPKHHVVTQIVDSSLPYSTIHTGKKWARRMRDFIQLAAVTYAGKRQSGDFDVAVGMPKELASMIGPLPPNVGVVTFGTEAGLNIVEGVAHFIVISRPLPPAAEVERLAGVIFGKPVERSEYEWVPAERLTWHKGEMVRTRSQGTVPKHPDPLVEAVRWQICEASIAQLIGRARLQRPGRQAVRVDILTNPTVDIPVTHFAALDDLKAILRPHEVRLRAHGIEVEGAHGRGFEAALTGRISDVGRDTVDISSARTGLEKSLEREKKWDTVYAQNAFAEAIQAKNGNSETATFRYNKGLYNGMSPFQPVSDRNPLFGAILPVEDLRQRARAKITLVPGSRPKVVRFAVYPDETPAEMRRRFELIAGFTFEEFEVSEEGCKIG
jgi:hypothetical protein